MMLVVVAWVPFRADSIDGAKNILAGMAGLNGFAIDKSYLVHLNQLNGLGDFLAEIGMQFTSTAYFKGSHEIFALALLLFISVALPNIQQLFYDYRPAFETYKKENPRLRFRRFKWHPTLQWSILTAVLFVVAVLNLAQPSEFLYFQF